MAEQLPKAQIYLFLSKESLNRESLYQCRKEQEEETLNVSVLRRIVWPP